jgi:Caspase domain
MRVTAALLCAALSLSFRASAAEARLALVVGSDRGGPDDEPLHFAQTDARRMRDLLVELGGVQAERALLVTGQGPGAVMQALIELRGRAAELTRLGSRVVLLFYYSGHGDEESLHLPGGNLPLAELRAAMERVPADLRLVFLDACRSAGRAKGVRSAPSFQVAPSPEGPHGSVEVRSSSAGEAAQESEELAGAVFTHFLLSGLRGAADADGDGRVTLAELYAYAYRRTLLRTGTGAVLQHPSALIDLQGAGEVVLSSLLVASSSLEMPGGADRYLVFSLPDAGVVAEVSGEGPTRLALPAGRFLVARQRSEDTGAALVSLPWGGHQKLDGSSFRAISRDELVTRGGVIALRDLQLEARAGVELMPDGTAHRAIRTGVLVSEARGLLALELDLAYLQGSATTAGLGGEERGLSAVPAIGLRAFFGPATLVASLGLDVRATWQQLERPDAARLRAAGLPTGESRAFTSAGPRAGLRSSVLLTRDVALSLALTAGAVARRETDPNASSRLAWHPLLGASLGAGMSF